MPSDASADPLVSSMLPLSRRRPMDEIVGPLPPPAWRQGAAVLPGRALVELCEPLFLLVCRLNRAGRLGLSPQGESAPLARRVRSEVLRILDSAAAATTDPAARSSLARVRRPLELFVDDAMSRRFAGPENDWLPLAGPGPGFYSLLEMALVETDAGATDRLAIFYTCLALGFQGEAGSGRSAETALARLSARLGPRMDADESAPICPDAYRHTDRRPLSEPVAVRLVAMLLAAMLLIAVVLAFNGTLYYLRVGSLQRDLNTFRRAAGIPTPALHPPGAPATPPLHQGGRP